MSTFDCRCGEPNCMHLELGYPFCTGCREHHRTPVAQQEPWCPVDFDSAALDEADKRCDADPGAPAAVSDADRAAALARFRWAAFTPGELDEIALALDHRLAEAEGGNAYVYSDEVAQVMRSLAPVAAARGQESEGEWLADLDRRMAALAARNDSTS